jgi:serine/threonine-protein kinase HipA
MARDVLALTLDGSKQFPQRKGLMAFARQACGLGESKAAELLERVASGVTNSIEEIRHYIAEHRDFERAGEHLIKTFERGLKRSILK